MEDVDVAVVGAGLAGLRCAASLVRRGHEVVVLEAADAVGGRIRTEQVDGYLVDRGFQLLNPAYPAVKQHVDVDALGLQTFAAGVAARTERGMTTLGHPLAAPGLLPATLGAVGRRPGEVAALARWVAPMLRVRPGRSLADVLARHADAGRAEAMDAAGLDGLLRRVMERFLSGVVLEDDGSTSHHFALLLARSFAGGTPGLPRAGMQALPEQLARPLGHRVRTGTPVRALRSTRDQVVVETDGEPVRARQVVVATARQDVDGVLGRPEPHPGGPPGTATRGVTTWWFAADDAPTDSHLLHVDARVEPTGPLVNVAVVSNPAPTYAPAGHHLVEARGPPAPPPPPARGVGGGRHAGDLLRADPSAWRVVARHDVPHALPTQPAPLQVRRRLRVDDQVLVCGDHRDTASIQGALVSGSRAAVEASAALA